MSVQADMPVLRRSSRLSRTLLPYLLSLPALLVCIGILVPFVTAICPNPGTGV
ncbi:hypothetical protein ACSSV1_005068 [Labrenzia sp. MBR-25]|jgi:multiple sugar transport system permease protein